MDQTAEMRTRWEAAHGLPRFQPRYPHEEVVRWAFRYLNRAQPSDVKVLDLGCGAGRHSLFLASEGFDVSACDISAAGIEHLEKVAQERGLRIKTHRCAAHDLGAYKSDSFDAVLYFGVMYYLSLKHARSSLREAHRVLKPGGRLFCATRTDNDSRRSHATEVGPSTWRLSSLGANAPSDSEAGMDMLFFASDEIPDLFTAFVDLQIDRIAVTHDGFRDDDWLVFGRKPAVTC